MSILTYSAILHLFKPGILRLPKETHVLRHLAFLEAAINDYNLSAENYNDAWATGVDSAAVNKLGTAMLLRNVDYRNAHLDVMNVITEIYTPQRGDVIPEPQSVHRSDIQIP